MKRFTIAVVAFVATISFNSCQQPLSSGSTSTVSKTEAAGALAVANSCISENTAVAASVRVADVAVAAGGTLTVSGAEGGSASFAYTTSIDATTYDLAYSGTITYVNFKVKYGNDTYTINGSQTLSYNLSMVESSFSFSFTNEGTLNIAKNSELASSHVFNVTTTMTVTITAAVKADTVSCTYTTTGTVDGTSVNQTETVSYTY